MIPTVERTLDDTLADCKRGKNRLSVDVESRDLLSKKSYLRTHNPFNYRICISWFGGVQIHPKF